MKRSLIAIGATAAGVAAVVAYRPHSQPASAAALSHLTTGNSHVAGAQTVVGSDQQLSGGLGDIQVKVTASNGKITSVGMAKMNLHGPQSQQISQSVIPQLEQQTLASNGASIQGVSGATYTSQAYARSLQAALDQFKGGGNAALAAGSNGNGGVVQGGGGFGTRRRRRLRPPRAAVARAQAGLRRADEVFSTWKPQSPVSRLRRGEIELEQAPPEVAQVLELCRRAREASQGWFDPWLMPGGLDPTGLVKGWAAERALQELRRAGLPGALINAGGDIAVFGEPEPGEPWRIGIRDPRDEQRIVLTVELRGAGAVATSGAYERGEHVLQPHGRGAGSRPLVGHRDRPRPGLRRRPGHRSLRLGRAPVAAAWAPGRLPRPHPRRCAACPTPRRDWRSACRRPPERPTTGHSSLLHPLPT